MSSEIKCKLLSEIKTTVQRLLVHFDVGKTAYVRVSHYSDGNSRAVIESVKHGEWSDEKSITEKQIQAVVDAAIKYRA